MPAAGEQGDEGWLERLVRQIRRRHVPADVVDRDERHAQRPGERLGKGQPDQERAQQPRPVGDGDRVDIGIADAGLAHGRLDRPLDCVGMGAGSDFRHNAAVLRLLRRGGNYDVG